MPAKRKQDTAALEELIAAARTIIRERYRQGRHHIGAAVRTNTGKIFAAVHLEARVGRAAICAEAVAIGMAVASGESEIAWIVAVDSEGRIVAPCGICRELIADYGPSAQVILKQDESGVTVRPISGLLPLKYRRHTA